MRRGSPFRRGEPGIFRRFSEFMRGSARKYAGGVLAVCATVAVSFLTPLLIGGTVDAVTAAARGDAGAPVNLPGALAAWFDARGGAGYLASNVWMMALLLVALSLLGGAFQYLRGRWSAEASEDVAERMRARLYAHLQEMDYGYHARAENWRLDSALHAGRGNGAPFLANQLIEAFRTVVMAALALWLMSRIHGRLTLISLALVPPQFLLAFWFFRWVRALFSEADEADGKLSAMLQESLTGVRVVRAFGRQRHESDRFAARADDVHDKSVRLSGVFALYWSGSNLITTVQTGLTLLFGVRFALRGEITTGDVMVFVSYVTMLIWPIRELGQILSDLGKSAVSLRRLYEILDAPAERDTPGASDAPLWADIEFDRVGFSYGGRPVLRDVSFTVRAGQTVAILGATGSGKTAMMNLLQRLYEPTSGCIRIGGRDIATISKACLRERVGYVLQEPFLYSRTIRDNIAIARPDASQAQIDAVARDTASDGFIAEFERGLRHARRRARRHAVRRQKQRLAIARTLLRDGDILILDDSLSAVDTETDKFIRAALRARRAGGRAPTTFLISHRIPTLADADWILVLEDGRVAQQGTHAQLIAEEGLYRRVYRIQTALEDELNRETA